MKEYFSHDYNTRSDEKIKNLIRKCGYSGYGVFWAIIEDLYNNANALRLDCEGIAYDYRVEESTVRSIIFDFDLFDYNDDFFWSNSVQKRLDIRNEKSEKAKKSAESRWKKGNNNANALKSDANALQSECDSNAIKEKEIKGKESKSNNNKDVREENATEVASHSHSEIELVEAEEIQHTAITTSVAAINENVIPARARKRAMEEREQDFYNSLIPYLAEYGADMIRAFYDYWTEPNQSKTKMKFELEKTWSAKRRLATWSKNQSKFDNNGFKTKRQQQEEQQRELAAHIAAKGARAAAGISDIDQDWADNVPI